MWSIVEQFEARAQGNPPLRHLWRRGQWAIRPAEGPRHQVRRVVLANALALISGEDDTPLDDLVELARQLGAGRLSDLQEEVLGPIDPAATRPRTTALVTRLARAAWWGADGADRELYAETVTRLVLHRGEQDGTAPAIVSRADVLGALHDGDLLSWRRQVAAIAAEPWAGPGSDWIALLDPGRDAFALACLSAHVDRAQRDAVAQERGAVSDHIRRTIARAGVSQREFARLIGTSQSRLSTYVSGSVVPSAAMLVRISQAGEGLRRTPRSG
ncbi:helix-turn-helix transcriptional regulator [Nocardioides sp. LHD-245]|uniref:helix-turn-helix domain-containing protein n=1 Tax=Nocardioides sp. LHD-245 TaxID=3051387 RepID=UPI0027DF478F|nr:helix-turn-helix transcriptional regulator [Nocardioides sp. LHD-245]